MISSQKYLRKENLIPSTGPSRTVLILGTVCFSVVLMAVAYKVGTAQKDSVLNPTVVGLHGTTTAPQQIVTNALQDAQINSLALENATSSNPFDIQPGDTVSDRVTKKIFTGYLYAQQTDGVTDQSSADVADAVISQITQADLPSPQFVNSQTITFTPTSNLEIKNYGNITAGVIIGNLKIIANNKAKYENNIVAIAQIYKKIGNELIKQKTPADIVTAHTSLANSFVLMGQGMEMIAKQDTDPVNALLGVKTTKEVGQSQGDVLINIGAYFKKNDIIFASNETGSFWNPYINATLDEKDTTIAPNN